MTQWAIKCFVPGSVQPASWGCMREWVNDKSQRTLYPSRRAALCESWLENLSGQATVAFVKVTRKPKAPAPLKWGIEDCRLVSMVDAQTVASVVRERLEDMLASKQGKSPLKVSVHIEEKP